VDEHDQPQPPDPGEPVLGVPRGERPVPELDPDTTERVRALLAAAGTDASTGPMPARVAQRIAAAIAEEQRLRIDPGPFAAATAASAGRSHTGGSHGAADMAGDQSSRGSVASLESRTRRRQRPWVAVAAVAAAAGVIAVGGSLLHANKQTDPAAVVIGDRATSAPAAPTAGSPGTATGPHIQLSTTDYAASTFASQARTLLDHPSTPLSDLAAEAPSLGPIATPIGLASCLDAIAAGPGAVTVDLATFAGRPAAIIVVTADGASTAYAVGRSCAPGHVEALAAATPVP
jgi:hypothetical protein